MPLPTIPGGPAVITIVAPVYTMPATHLVSQLLARQSVATDATDRPEANPPIPLEAMSEIPTITAATLGSPALAAMIPDRINGEESIERRHIDSGTHLNSEYCPRMLSDLAM